MSPEAAPRPRPRGRPVKARGHGTCAPALAAAAGLATLARTALDALLPPACVACGSGLPGGTAPVCSLCWHRLPRVAPPRCERCGASCLRDAPEGCAECQDWPAALDRAAAPFRMEGTAAVLVHALKYGGWRTLAAPMGEAMASAARRLTGADGRFPGAEGRAADDDGRVVLVPVPLAAARQRERGFNQALLLARSLAEVTGWGVWEGLARRRTGRRQASLGRASRAENVRSLFQGRYPQRGTTAERATALLVDDVLTTGATAAACALALEEAGTPCAGVVSFARVSAPLEGRAAEPERPSLRSPRGRLRPHRRRAAGCGAGRPPAGRGRPVSRPWRSRSVTAEQTTR